MNKIRIIDLLNKIANGETVLFKYRDITYYYNYDFKEYISTQKYYRQGDIMEHYFLLEEIDMTNLNDTVEILEEEKKIPEKIKIMEKSITVKGTTFFRDKDIEIFQKLSMEINEIIDCLDYLKSKGE